MLYGVDFPVNITRIQNDFKLHISKSVGLNAKSLKSLFKKYDQNGNSKLEFPEFEKALAGCGYFPKLVDLQALFKWYDKDHDGTINFQEFMNSLRVPLNERRLKMILKVFSFFDKNKEKMVQLQDLSKSYLLTFNQVNNYDASLNLDLINNQKTEEQIKQEFAEYFEKPSNTNNITIEEFIQYYEDLSLTVYSDQTFIDGLQHVWGIAEDEESTATKEEIASIMQSLHQKLLIKTEGNKSDKMLKKLFYLYDQNQNGFISFDELSVMLYKLNVAIKRKFLGTLFKILDQNQSGYIEYEEFVKFIMKENF